jgi:DNA-binding CsgD family transcriptional regulator
MNYCPRGEQDVAKRPFYPKLQLGADLDLVVRLLRALAKSDSADDFCRAMALNVLSEFDVVATYVARLDSDAHVTMIGSYGYSRQRVENTPRPSIWEPMAITEAIRSGKVMIYKSWTEYIEKYPDKGHLASPGQAFVCLPLEVRGVKAGGFGITFAKPLDEVGFSPALWEVFSLVGDVFLTKGWETEMQRFPVPTTDFGDDNKFAASSLSAREREVLVAIALGLTNSKIARRLKFSESTIKQDTIRIFKILGVKNRADAVLAAKGLGLVDATAG